MDRENKHGIYPLRHFVVEQELDLPTGSVDSAVIEYSPDHDGIVYIDIKMPVSEYDERVKRILSLKNAYAHRKHK